MYTDSNVAGRFGQGLELDSYLCHCLAPPPWANCLPFPVPQPLDSSAQVTESGLRPAEGMGAQWCLTSREAAARCYRNPVSEPGVLLVELGKTSPFLQPVLPGVTRCHSWRLLYKRVLWFYLLPSHNEFCLCQVFKDHSNFSSHPSLPLFLREKLVYDSVVNELSKSFSITQNNVTPSSVCHYTTQLYSISVYSEDLFSITE